MAENVPLQSVFGYEAGRKLDCLIGNVFQAIPVTIPSNRFNPAGQLIKGPSLWVRGSVSPYYAVPYGLAAEISGQSSTTITLIDPGQVNQFKVGDKVDFFDYTGLAWANQIKTVTAVDAVAGTVTTDTAFSGVTAANDDLLCVVNSSTLGLTAPSGTVVTADQNACVILEDVYIAGADQGTKAYIMGTFVKSLVRGVNGYVPLGGAKTLATGLFNKNNNAHLHFIDIAV